MLVRLDNPSTKAESGTGSGLLSLDNDDRTARNCREAYERHGVSHADVVHWNVVPFPVAGVKNGGSSCRTSSVRAVDDRVRRLVPEYRERSAARRRCSSRLGTCKYRQRLLRGSRKDSALFRAGTEHERRTRTLRCRHCSGRTNASVKYGAGGGRLSSNVITRRPTNPVAGKFVTA